MEFLHDLRTFTQRGSLEVESCWRDATTVEINLTADIRVKMGREGGQDDHRATGGERHRGAGHRQGRADGDAARVPEPGLSWQPHGVQRQTYHQGHEERFKEKVRALWGAGMAGLEEGASGIQALLALEGDKELKRKVVKVSQGRPRDRLAEDGRSDATPRYRPRKYETKESAKAREREHILGVTSNPGGATARLRAVAESPWRTTTLYDVVQDIGAAAVLAATRRERRKMEGGSRDRGGARDRGREGVGEGVRGTYGKELGATRTRNGPRGKVRGAGAQGIAGGEADYFEAHYNSVKEKRDEQRKGKKEPEREE